MDYQHLISGIKNELVSDLAEWVQINSVHDDTTATVTAPFGRGVSNALAWMAQKARQDGFEVVEYDGYVVEITYGDLPETVMILGHADVVPEGDGWTDDPFSGLLKNGRIYGRGTQDDKGPTLAAYYGMKLIKRLGLPLKRKLRLVVGGNEELGSRCMHYYFDTLKKPAPTMGFTPDAEFPLIYAEKGIMNVQYSGAFADDVLVSFKAGTAANVVIEKATAIVKGDFSSLTSPAQLYAQTHHLQATVTRDDDYVRIFFVGQAAHGSKPEAGINAGTHLLTFLAQTTSSAFARHYAPITHDHTGRALNLYRENAEMGVTTLNTGVIEWVNGTYKFVLNYRYPNEITSAEIQPILQEAFGGTQKMLSDSPVHYVDPKSELVATLLKSYQDISGDLETQPFTIGGGTYARTTKNVVAFGMAFPYSQDLMHQRDESIPVDELLLGASIYFKALVDLACYADSK